MRCFLLLTNTSLVCSITAGLQNLALSRKVEVESVYRTGIVFRKGNESVYLMFDLLAKLAAVEKEVEARFGVEGWNGLLNSRLAEEERREVIDCVKERLFRQERYEESVFALMKVLLVFNTSNYVLFTAMLSSALQLAEELRYTRIEEFYNTVLYKMDKMNFLMNSFLEITPKSDSDISNNNLTQTIKYISENIKSPEFSLERVYRRIKKNYTIRWKISKHVLQRLFSRDRVLENEVKYVKTHYVDYVLKYYKAFLTLRTLDYPEEKDSYATVLGIYTLEEFITLSVKKPETTILEVCLCDNNTVSSDVLMCRWNRLIVDEGTDISAVFYDNKDREVNFLELRSEDSAEKYRLVGCNNRISVLSMLTLDNVEGEIDFVDVTDVKKAEIYNTRNVKFGNNNEKQIFSNAKTLLIKESDLNMLLYEDDTLLFPNLDLLVIEDCTITNKIYKILTDSIRVVRIEKSNFVDGVTEERIRARTRCRNLFFVSKERKLSFGVFIDEALTKELESKYNLTRLDSCNRKIFVATQYVSNIASLLMENPECIERTRQNVRRSLVHVEFDYMFKINTLRAIEDVIVFLHVYEIEYYVQIKRIFSLRSLKYLSVLWLGSKKEKLRKLEAEPHELEVLIILNIYGKEQGAVIRTLFNKKTLACLDVSFPSENKVREELVSCFVNLRVLLIYIEISECYDKRSTLLDRIEELSQLEVLEISFHTVYKYDDKKIELVELLTRIVDKCKRMKRIGTVLYSLSLENYERIGPEITSCDGRSYALRTELSSYKKNACVVALKETTIADREMQEVFLLLYLAYKEHASISEKDQRRLDVVYELEVKRSN